MQERSKGERDEYGTMATGYRIGPHLDALHLACPDVYASLITPKRLSLLSTCSRNVHSNNLSKSSFSHDINT